jgi:hypothetical protein
MTEDLPDWLRPRPRPHAIICDIDDTICVMFDQPILAAIRVLAALDRSIEVHYVTARPEASREGTERFLMDQRLPGWRNLHLCPSWRSSRAHKAEVIARLAREHRVIVSIGDHEEEAEASRAASVAFVQITGDNWEEAWIEVEARVAAALQALREEGQP